jgi:DNA-binding NarL/FixJ family response regulator
MSETLSILVVDDHRIFAEGLVAVLQLRFPHARFILAHSGTEAWDLIRMTPHYQLVISDISMGEMSGLELATRIKGQFPAIKVLILSMHNERNIVSAAMDTEAEGFVLKSANALDIESAIKDILDGSTHYSREVLAILLEKVKQEKKQDAIKILLTDREREILKLILEEYSTGEIAEMLFISKRTVDTHRANLLEKTGCHSLIALYKFAIRHHLTDPNISTTT